MLGANDTVLDHEDGRVDEHRRKIFGTRAMRDLDPGRNLSPRGPPAQQIDGVGAFSQKELGKKHLSVCRGHQRLADQPKHLVCLAEHDPQECLLCAARALPACAYTWQAPCARFRSVSRRVEGPESRLELAAASNS